MVTVIGVIGFVTVISLAVNSAIGDDGKDLQFLHIVMRHGIRTPASTYPKDPYINESFYPDGWGQLTNAGKLLQYNTGKFLRERYGKFLGDFYNPDEYYSQSTDVDRVRASLALANAGLWPPKDAQKWGPLDWQPIPIHSEPLDQDSLLLVRRPCAQYHMELDQVKKSEEYLNLFKKYEPLMNELTNITGQNIKSFEDVADVYTTLLAEQAYNLTLPEWTKDYFPTKMLEPSAFSYKLNAFNEKLNRFKGGVLLKKILTDWASKIDGTIKPSKRKAFLYGAHDSTIANLLSTLNVFEPHVPGYGVAILLELSKDTQSNVYGVEVYYRNDTAVPPYKMKIPGCDEFCPLEKLKDLTKNVIPKDWDQECHTDDKNYTLPPPSGP